MKLKQNRFHFLLWLSSTATLLGWWPSTTIGNGWLELVLEFSVFETTQQISRSRLLSMSTCRHGLFPPLSETMIQSHPLASPKFWHEAAIPHTCHHEPSAESSTLATARYLHIAERGDQSLVGEYNLPMFVASKMSNWSNCWMWSKIQQAVVHRVPVARRGGRVSSTKWRNASRRFSVQMANQKVGHHFFGWHSLLLNPGNLEG